MLYQLADLKMTDDPDVEVVYFDPGFEVAYSDCSARDTEEAYSGCLVDTDCWVVYTECLAADTAEC